MKIAKLCDQNSEFLKEKKKKGIQIRGVRCIYRIKQKEPCRLVVTINVICAYIGK